LCAVRTTQHSNGCANEALFNTEEAFNRCNRKISRWHQMMATALRKKNK